jgi:hypothetical protein
MSDNIIRWIPVKPSFVPRDAEVARAVAWLQARAPQADVVTAKLSDEIRFVDCGGNFEAIYCPRCETVVPFEWWREKMDLSAAIKFETRGVQLPCCGANEALETLRYHWPAGFARFVLEVRNARIDRPTAEDDLEIGRLLGTAVRCILAHY